jgi:diguanylate cyclase (GGDEF)-like protein
VDLICRYGGEEFAVILPGVDLARAITVAERARQAAAALAIRTAAGIITVTRCLRSTRTTGEPQPWPEP